jgi:hypothetical protein
MWCTEVERAMFCGEVKIMMDCKKVIVMDCGEVMKP